ncbi:hypothetical protein BH23PSE2_BH23PSE2_02100 [soil metagenome]
MNRLLLASALLAMTATASAQSTAPAAEVDPDVQGQAVATEMSLQHANRDAVAERLCLRQTGSRIIASRHLQSRDDMRGCVAGNGRVYTRADLDSTGAVDIANALRRLDPAIR